MKFTFSKAEISEILLSPKLNISNFVNLTLFNISISDIRLFSKYNSFKSLKFSFLKIFEFQQRNI